MTINALGGWGGSTCPTSYSQFPFNIMLSNQVKPQGLLCTLMHPLDSLHCLKYIIKMRILYSLSHVFLGPVSSPMALASLLLGLVHWLGCTPFCII